MDFRTVERTLRLRHELEHQAPNWNPDLHLHFAQHNLNESIAQALRTTDLKYFIDFS